MTQRTRDRLEDRLYPKSEIQEPPEGIELDIFEHKHHEWQKWGSGIRGKLRQSLRK